MAALLLFWFGIRTCKFLFLGTRIPRITVLLLVRLLHTDDTDPSRSGIYLACCLGRPESYHVCRHSVKGDCRFSGDTSFILLILTNNCHQKVFAFPFGMEDAECIYVHKPLYFVCLGWMFAEVIAFLALLLVRSHVPNKKADLGTSDTGSGSFFILYRISYGEQDPFHDRRRYDSCYDFDHAVGL